MEFISDLPFIGGTLSAVIGFVIVLGIVVFVHEYGHYIVGRWCGIHADTFSMGFGPVVRRWTDKRGTIWQIAALPLGGYVKFLGDADGSSRADPSAIEGMDETERQRSFQGAALWKRALTVAAGPFFNFFLSIALFAGLVSWLGIAQPEPVIGKVTALPGQETTLRAGDEVLGVNGQPVEDYAGILDAAVRMPNPGPVEMLVRRDGEELRVTTPYLFPPLVADVTPFSAASRAGLETGDLIIAIDGNAIAAFTELRDQVLASDGRTMELQVQRGLDQLTLPITPKVEEHISNMETMEVEKRVMIGVSSDGLLAPSTLTPPPWEALVIGTERVWLIIDRTFRTIGRMIEGVLSPSNLQGPLGIAQMSGDQVTKGWVAAISFIAVISTAIGMLNLFPIPVLDGGHLVMFAYEAVAGRPPADRVTRVAMAVGLSMVLLLMVFATYNDLVRLFVS